MQEESVGPDEGNDAAADVLEAHPKREAGGQEGRPGLGCGPAPGLTSATMRYEC